jgi:hypothetical protein
MHRGSIQRRSPDLIYTGGIEPHLSELQIERLGRLFSRFLLS